jgi:hypothetical protein
MPLRRIQQPTWILLDTVLCDCRSRIGIATTTTATIASTKTSLVASVRSCAIQRRSGPTKRLVTTSSRTNVVERRRMIHTDGIRSLYFPSCFTATTIIRMITNTTSPNINDISDTMRSLPS